ncbi:MAG: hypothetical protein ABJO27_21100 [Pseudoruegeria sp.]
MPKRYRLTRRFPAAMTEDAYRKLRRFSQEADLTPDEALTFLFENFNSITDDENLPHRLRLFQADLAHSKQRDKP